MIPSPRPLDGEVHLYCLTLPHDVSELTRFEHMLSTTETHRAGMLKSDLARNRYIAGRGVLRDILGGYLDIDPADVQIATGKYGKPFLADDAVDLRFNLSHVDEMLVVACAAGVEVGVDIERISTGKAIHDMAQLAFSRQEQEELHAMPDSQQVEAFYRCWVRKEACLKACGSGFSLPGSIFTVSGHTEAPTVSRVYCDKTFWHVLDIDVPHNYCAALAVESRSSDSPLPETVLMRRPL